MFVCPICENNPGSHSFDFIGERERINYFYSCPGNASKYHDYNGVLNHIGGVLESKKGEPWIFVFDCSGFGFVHGIQVQLSIAIVKLVTDKYSEYLECVYIKNSNGFISQLLDILLPFLCENIKKRIVRL